MNDDKDVMLAVENLKKHFEPHQSLAQAIAGQKRRKLVRAVDGVTFEIRKGEIFGLIGESGSGKTTTGKLVMKLIEPTAGKMIFAGEEIGRAHV